MEAVRQTINSSLLNGVIQLPKGLQNKDVEVIVFLKEEKTGLPLLSRGDMDAMLDGSVTESLIGIIPLTGSTLEEYRAERLSKYERTN
jgi:protein involved in polysaccharide export with SLBB domain